MKPSGRRIQMKFKLISLKYRFQTWKKMFWFKYQRRRALRNYKKITKKYKL